MTGSHRVIVESERIKYDFVIRRNITVIQGNSGTGKTTLIEALNEYTIRGDAGGIRLQSDVPCVVYSGGFNHYESFMKELTGSIIFIDEDYAFINTEKFAETVKESDNYYVIITRQPLYNLPYSIKEIYGIRTSGKYHFPEQVYHELYPLYDEEKPQDNQRDVLLILEDNNSGFEFYKKSLKQVECISAEGNGNIYKVVEDNINKNKNIIVIADGAAFGAYINKIEFLIKKKHIGLYLPESFEWMILKSGVIQGADIKKILDKPEDYIDSSLFFSWERYFSQLLETKTENDQIMRYKKNQLPDYYTSELVSNRILNVIPYEIRRCLIDIKEGN